MAKYRTREVEASKLEAGTVIKYKNRWREIKSAHRSITKMHFFFTDGKEAESDPDTFWTVRE